MVFDVSWVGDGASRLSRPRDFESWRLLMRSHAITTSFRTAIAAELRARWLPEACAWAAAAPDRGNAWGASDHRWMLIETDGVLSHKLDLL